MQHREILQSKEKVAALLELTAGFSADMTGRENIYLKCCLLGLENDEIKAIEENIIDFAKLGEYIDQPVRTYSSGMKMRLGFAININIKPDILVIDEALSVGDAEFRKKCESKIKRTQRIRYYRAVCKSFDEQYKRYLRPCNLSLRREN